MNSPGKLDGKVIIVTGASSGIGAAAALEFAKQGAKLVLASRTESKLQAVCEDIKNATGAEVTYCAADISQDEGNKRVVETAMSTFGGLHASFINAGYGSFTSILEMTDEIMDGMIGPDFKGVVFGLKHQIPAMSKTGDTGSIIVNTSATGERVAVDNPSSAMLSCVKAAANMAVRYGAVEGAPMNVRVNGVAPGFVATPLSKDFAAGREEEIKAGQLIKQFTKPEDLAAFVAFLASDDAKIMTGAIYPVDAGSSIAMR